MVISRNTYFEIIDQIGEKTWYFRNLPKNSVNINVSWKNLAGVLTIKLIFFMAPRIDIGESAKNTEKIMFLQFL